MDFHKESQNDADGASHSEASPADPSMDPSGFLNFDYGMDWQQLNHIPPALPDTIPNDFFQFVTEQSLTTSSEPNRVSSTTPDKPQATAQATPQPAITPEPSMPSPIYAGQKRPYRAVDTPLNQTVFTLVVGGQPFRLSWESLKSDGPSNFFTNYFRKQKTRVMHIDRSPDTFALVVRHLRGYYVRPQDDLQNQDLLNDARYYGLTRLKKMLEEYLYINVGGKVFRLSWDLFKKDGTHNFFYGPLMHSLFAPHGNEAPPVYIERDPDIFADIITHLRGYTIHIKDEVHRKNLLKDAQYYAFRQLTDRLLTAQRTVDGFTEEGSAEVLLQLQDVRMVGLQPPKAACDKPGMEMTCEEWSMSRVQYKREGALHALLIQISNFYLHIHDNTNGVMIMMCRKGAEMKKLDSIADTIKTRGVNERVYLDDACAMTVDDREEQQIKDLMEDERIKPSWEICQKCPGNCRMLKLAIQRAIAGVHVVGENITLTIARLEAISSRLRMNMKREFLPE
ncbi:hypothetical protein DFQ28_000198 [Apophysomyces sp. BC1034]|nr:hypothetical protein DFQ30_000255 [Apophysomyces sp. BC1015]KAG0176068.1 hypothetical protein DFQ29_006605 [Apophysomyces sp. BC1021]KAG0191427.1 hypothetical protein DFQ28_000198 [Apophysomyces sp. BC1034]